MARCVSTLRHGFLSYHRTKLFIKNVVKRHKSGQNALCAGNINSRDDVSSEHQTVTKIPKYMRIAGENNLDLNDFISKPQNQDEIENIFKEIAQGDDNIEKQLRLILYEVMIKREEEDHVPSVLRKTDWEELLKLKTFSMRIKYLNFLYKTEKKKESGRIKEALRKKEHECFERSLVGGSHLYYGLTGYSMFLRIYPQTLLRVQDLRALTNKLFESPILFDCSYQEYMNEINTRNCALQMALSVQLNRAHAHPCTLQLVNLKKDDVLMEYLKCQIPNLGKQPVSFEIYENSYLDMYPKERLVYLTPHTSNLLQEFKPDDIYIIGAYVDKGHGVQASLAKAKEQGLRMAKLPLDKFLLWKKGTKSLTLNSVLRVLLDLRFYRNWQKALKAVPSRNFRN